MLFYCVWPDEASLLLDVEDLAKAKAAAIEETGKTPTAIVPFVGVFGAELVFNEDGTITVELLQHTIDALEDAEEKLTPDEGASPPAPTALHALCTSESEDDSGKVLSCELAARHDDDHKSGVWTWANEKKRTG